MSDRNQVSTIQFEITMDGFYPLQNFCGMRQKIVLGIIEKSIKRPIGPPWFSYLIVFFYPNVSDQIQVNTIQQEITINGFYPLQNVLGMCYRTELDIIEKSVKRSIGPHWFRSVIVFYLSLYER